MTAEQIKVLKQMRTDYAQAFGSEGGTRVLADLEGRCFSRDTTFIGGADNIYINEGRRQVLLHIRSMMALPVEEAEGDIA